MITSIVIIILSLAMFAYWFRYSCVLILESGLDEGAVRTDVEIASVRQLQQQLASVSLPQELEQLKTDLDRGLRDVQAMLLSRSSAQMGGQSLECRMLVLNYRLMGVWYSVTRAIVQTSAKNALQEMSQIVSYLALEARAPLAEAES